MRTLVLLALAAVLLPLPGCGSDTSEDRALVIYSGRSQNLVEPLLERFRETTGINVQARYGTDAELLVALAEEGGRSPAHIFWANTAGALGAAVEQGFLTQLPDSLLQRPSAFTPSGGQWVPSSVRFRVLAFRVDADVAEVLPADTRALPSIAQLQGRIGWTPTYSSFQDFITAMRLTWGDDAARDWLRGMSALNPRSYPGNTAMLEALAAGEVDVALTNHYYVLRLLQRQGEGGQPNVAMHRFAAGDPGNLALVTGAGILQPGTEHPAALRFLEFLLSEDAQQMIVDSVQEYPVVEGTRPDRCPLRSHGALVPTSTPSSCAIWTERSGCFAR
jgi:iron(III) transport system substrate-binding protein